MHYPDFRPVLLGYTKHTIYRSWARGIMQGSWKPISLSQSDQAGAWRRRKGMPLLIIQLMEDFKIKGRENIMSFKTRFEHYRGEEALVCIMAVSYRMLNLLRESMEWLW
jgi:hypothetical protein